jgi:hypothetical protein
MAWHGMAKQNISGSRHYLCCLLFPLLFSWFWSLYSLFSAVYHHKTKAKFTGILGVGVSVGGAISGCWDGRKQGDGRMNEWKRKEEERRKERVILLLCRDCIVYTVCCRGLVEGGKGIMIQCNAMPYHTIPYYIF